MNKKGFTLIELLTVIAILGILVLLAAPKFLGYTEKANIAKIQTGIKSVETAIDLNLIENPDLTKDWDVLSPDKLQEINDSGKLIDKKGFIKEDLDEGKVVSLKDLDDLKWNSGGEFILSEKDESVYYYNKDMNVSKKPDGSATIPDDNDGNGGDDSSNTQPPVAEPEITYPIIHENGDIEYEDGKITTEDGGERQSNGSVIYPDGSVKNPGELRIHPDGSVTLEDGTYVPVSTDSDFKWISDNTSSYSVEGKGKGYYYYTGTESVVVIPQKIDGHTMTSYFRMFSGINVSKVISSNKQIYDITMMFYASPATTVDLSDFETFSLNHVVSAFQLSRLETVYVKTTNDATKLNSSTNKPLGLKFIVK